VFTYLTGENPGRVTRVKVRGKRFNNCTRNTNTSTVFEYDENSVRKRLYIYVFTSYIRVRIVYKR